MSGSPGVLLTGRPNRLGGGRSRPRPGRPARPRARLDRSPSPAVNDGPEALEGHGIAGRVVSYITPILRADRRPAAAGAVITRLTKLCSVGRVVALRGGATRPHPASSVRMWLTNSVISAPPRASVS